MRVFVAGASGAVGRRLVPLLIEAGHSVVGLTRTLAKQDMIRRAGAEPVVGDALERAGMERAVVGAKPDVIVHELTALSGVNDLRHFDRTYAMSNRLRTEGLDILIAAARKAGARRIIAQSFCGWPFARKGGFVKTEQDPLDSQPPQELRRTLDAIRYLEGTMSSLSDMQGITLRYGAFYGRDTGLFDGPMIRQLRARRAPIIGDGGGWWSFLNIDDAAAATARAVDAGSPGIYNIADDDPAPVREWLPALAAMLGAAPPRHAPKWLARLVAGDHVVKMMTEARAGSNAKAKSALSWRPAHASWRQGFAEVLSQIAN